ncbi:YciI family protein [Streptomyces sp. NPDC086787]|uniref:YciI family protein n=1 Tax=Streptomyces sp. NPDC086787 TaxID=3365759 RepID=UPI003829B4DD
MFVLEVTYNAPLDTVKAVLPAHKAWLDEHFKTGTFLASGRKEPRDGGIIIAAGKDRARIDEILAKDPFVTEGVGTYRVVAFTATTTAPELERYRETLD